MDYHGGGRTQAEWDELAKATAIAAIRKWQAVPGTPLTDPVKHKEARMAVYWALWPLTSRALVLDGKRYKADRRKLDVVVTDAPTKKGGK